MPPSTPPRSNTPRSNMASRLAEAEVRMFHASSAFVSACQEATVAMHALTAKIRELEKQIKPARKPRLKARSQKNA